MNSAAAYAANSYNASSSFLVTVRRPPASGAWRLHLLVRVDDRLPVGAGLLHPVADHHVADLLQVGRELRRRGDDVHALRLELVEIPLVLFLRQRPAARLGIGGGLQDGVLR